MTTLQIIDDEIKTLEAERLIIAIAHDHLKGMKPEELIDKYVFKVKDGIKNGWFNIKELTR